MSASVSDLGIIVFQVRFGEADKLVKILSRHHGLIAVIAKGARRLTSKKSSHLDNLNLISFSTNRGHSPQYLSQVETVNAFPSIKADLKKVRTAFYLLEVLNATMAENQIDEALFTAFRDFLLDFERTGEDSDRQKAVAFQQFLITHLGFPPPPNSQPRSLVSYFEHIIDKSLVSPRIKMS